MALYLSGSCRSRTGAYFHVISKDTGFDPLIQHLKGRKILAARWRDVSEIPLLKVPNGKSPDEKMAAIVAHLQLRAAARPRSVATLSNTISALFQKQLAESEIEALPQSLQSAGHVTVAGTKVSYSLPS